MANANLDILVRAVGASQAAAGIHKVDSAVGKLGRTAATGVRTAGANIAKIGLVVAGGVALAVRGGLQSLAELESATSSVSAAITQMGEAGQITAGQVATWSQQIETAVGSAFDDKAILQASTTLIRFGHVIPANLQAAMVVMTDLATKTGDVDSAATLLAKALADPVKAAGKLARSGVILTAAQQAQIKAFMKAGKVAQAQKVILDALTVSTKGAALASQGPYARSLSVLKDVTEDAQRALAEGFLPVIEKVRSILSTELAKPQTLQNIRDFGKGLAAGLGNLIDIAKGLPWSSIGTALKIGGAGAKAVLDAFIGMPPWVQTAVLTGWGLNKLTGGAVGSIFGQLASGLIKGVLGMNAGVVNINAGVVNGGGGVGGLAGKAGIAAGGVGLAAGIASILAIPVAIGVANLIREAAGITPEESARRQSTGQFGNRSLGNPDYVLKTATNPILSQIAYREQRLGEITGGKSDIIAAKTARTYDAIERTRLSIVAAVNAGTVATLSMADRIRIGYISSHTVRDSQTSYASNTTTNTTTSPTSGTTDSGYFQH